MSWAKTTLKKGGYHATRIRHSSDEDQVWRELGQMETLSQDDPLSFWERSGLVPGMTLSLSMCVTQMSSWQQENEPDVGVTSVNYKLADLLNKGKGPC